MPEEISGFLSPGLSELAGLLLSTESFTELVQEVAELAVRTVEPVVTCGITLAQQGRVLTATAADDLARQRMNSSTRSTPDLVCRRWPAGGRRRPESGSRVAVAGLSGDRDGAHGILSVYSVPLIVVGNPSGCSTSTPAPRTPSALWTGNWRRCWPVGRRSR